VVVVVVVVLSSSSRRHGEGQGSHGYPRWPGTVAGDGVPTPSQS
jgi:hypothetical protein